MTAKPEKPSKLAGLAQNTADGVTNIVTGMGTARDKSAYNILVDVPPLDEYTLEVLYANDKIAQIIVNKIVDDAMREGFCLERDESHPELDAEESEIIMDRWKELQADDSRFKRGAYWGRLMGGGLIFAVEGAGGLRSPLEDDKITDVRYLIDFMKSEMTVSKWAPDGTPLMYTWTPERSGPTTILPTEIHHTRIMRFPGAVTTAKRRRDNESWDLSVLQAVYEDLLSYGAMWGSLDGQLSDSSQGVLHLSGLIESLAQDAGGPQDVKTRLQLLNMGRSSVKMLMLDAGDEEGNGKEDFKVVERASLGGLSDLVKSYMERIAGLAEVPVSILFGGAPGGDQSAGIVERGQWYGRVDAYRREVLGPRIIRIVRAIAQSEGDPNPEAWKIRWPELETLDPMARATAEKLAIDASVSLITAQVALPEEVALSLKRIAPSLGLTLDSKSRLQALTAGLEEVAAREVGLAAEEASLKVQAENAPAPAPGAAGPKGKTPAAKPTKRKTTSAASKGAKQG